MTVNRTAVFFASVAPLADEAFFAEAYASAPPFRQAKIDRLTGAADQRRSLGVDLLLRRVLTEQGLSPEYAYDTLGKPVLPENKAFISLSHAGETVACALSFAPVGCDVEAIKPVDDRLAARFFAKEEADFLASLPAAERDKAFFRLWTRKESLMKATGKGMKLSFRLPALSPNVLFEEKPYFYADYENLPSYCLAACVQGESEIMFCQYDF